MFFYSNATTTSRFTSNAHKLQLAHFCRSPVDWSGAQEASLQMSRENARENFSLLFFFVVAWLKCNRLGLYCLHFLRLFPGRGIFSHARHTARLDRHVHERESHQRLCVGLVIARNLKPTFLSSFIYFSSSSSSLSQIEFFFLRQHTMAGAMLVHPGLLFIEETIFNIFSVFRVYLLDKHSGWMSFVQSDCSYHALRIFYHFK